MGYEFDGQIEVQRAEDGTFQASIDQAVSAAVAKAGPQAAQAERTRVLSIQSYAMAGSEDIVKACIEDAGCTAEQAAVKILQNEKAATATAAAVADAAAPQALPAIPPAVPPTTPEAQQAKRKPDDFSAESLAAEWQGSTPLKAEFPTERSYQAYMQATQGNRIKIK